MDKKNIRKPLLDPVVLSTDHPTSCFPFYFKLQEVVSLSPPLPLTLVPGFWRPHPPKTDLTKSTPTTGVKAMMFCSSYLPGQFFYISFFFLLSQNSFPPILWCLILFLLLFFWFFSDHFFFTRIPFISSDNSSNVDIPQASIFDHLVYSFPNSVSGIIIVGVPKIVILLNTSSTSLPIPSLWLADSCHEWCTCAKLLQSCLTVTCSPPGSSVHGILQARILAWIAMPSSRGSSLPRDCLLHWQLSSLPLGPPGKPMHNGMVLICKHSKKVYSLSWFHYYWHYDGSEACIPRPIPWWKPENHPWMFPTLSLLHINNNFQSCPLLALLSTLTQTPQSLGWIILESCWLFFLWLCDS